MYDELYHEKGFSYLAAIEKKRKLPDWVEDEPFLEPAEEWLLRAYYDLGTGRGIDGAIPWRDMLLYAQYSELEPDVAEGFIRVMRVVDAEKLKRQRDKQNGVNADGVEVEGNDARASQQLELHNRVTSMQTASKEQMMAAARNRAGRKTTRGAQ